VDYYNTSALEGKKLYAFMGRLKKKSLSAQKSPLGPDINIEKGTMPNRYLDAFFIEIVRVERDVRPNSWR
jgi:hypothetical protein